MPLSHGVYTVLSLLSQTSRNSHFFASIFVGNVIVGIYYSMIARGIIDWIYMPWKLQCRIYDALQGDPCTTCNCSDKCNSTTVKTSFMEVRYLALVARIRTGESCYYSICLL